MRSRRRNENALFDGVEGAEILRQEAERLTKEAGRLHKRVERDTHNG
jgi:hypothetical protein